MLVTPYTLGRTLIYLSPIISLPALELISDTSLQATHLTSSSPTWQMQVTLNCHCQRGLDIAARKQPGSQTGGVRRSYAAWTDKLWLQPALSLSQAWLYLSVTWGNTPASRFPLLLSRAYPPQHKDLLHKDTESFVRSTALYTQLARKELGSCHMEFFSD